MKKVILIWIVVLSGMTACAARSLNPKVRGVWANATSELVQTDSVLMYFTRNDSLEIKSATLIIPSRGVDRTTVFTPDAICFEVGEPLEIVVGDQSITVNGEPMRLIEDIKIVEPYKPIAANDFNTAQCLQQWQLGTRILSLGGENCHVMIDTNNNSFMYMVGPQMTYIRAASLRHTGKGSVFMQNIRMMKNMNTGEYTHYSAPDNYAVLTHLPEIDGSKFVSGKCTFANEGIYWSFVSSEPYRITLNGCGEEYVYTPSEVGDGIVEWFEFVPQPDWLATLRF